MLIAKSWMFSVLLGIWPCIMETKPRICPSDLLYVLFSSQPLSVNDEQSEKHSKDNTIHTTVCIPHNGFNIIISALVLLECSYI